jgi:hypothetical protein
MEAPNRPPWLDKINGLLERKRTRAQKRATRSHDQSRTPPSVMRAKPFDPAGMSNSSFGSE